MTILDRVFKEVTSLFIYRSDQEAWGSPEYWSSPKERCVQEQANGCVIGDCDDFALMCRERLDNLGIQNRLVFCQVETGEYHLVCESLGNILDNRQTMVMPRQLLNYKWLAISGVKQGDPWHKIEE